MSTIQCESEKTKRKWIKWYSWYCTIYNLCDMSNWLMLPKQESNWKWFWAPPSHFGPCFISFCERRPNFTRFALELQASNPETRKLKKISIDMEDAIFNGVQWLFPDVSKLYCVRHMKQQDEIKIGNLLAKFKCSENEKVFKSKQEKIFVGKNLTDFGKYILFYIHQITFPSKLCTSFF